MRFWKYHALGNDYIVLRPQSDGSVLTPSLVQRFCDRHLGIGSDGILLGLLPAATFDGGAGAAQTAAAGALRIYNPDGSEAEKSGNGLRIFSRFLYDTGQVGCEPFSLVTKGGPVRCQVADGGGSVTVAMGRVSFNSAAIPVSGPVRDVLRERLCIGGHDLTICAATVGNPHCVVLDRGACAEDARTLGPQLETHALFPERTNVQFLEVLDRGHLRIEIWERGAGYTLASGSSASACAAVARKLDLCDAEVIVTMPGGDLWVRVDRDFAVTQRGPVTAVAVGEVAADLLAGP